MVLTLTREEEDTILEAWANMEEKPEMASISKQELASHIALQTDYELKDGRFARLLVATGSSDFTNRELIELLEAEMTRLKGH